MDEDNERLSIRELPEGWERKIRDVSMVVAVKNNINLDEMLAPKWVWENLLEAAMRRH